jgi:hypothetical protein
MFYVFSRKILLDQGGRQDLCVVRSLFPLIVVESQASGSTSFRLNDLGGMQARALHEEARARKGRFSM